MKVLEIYLFFAIFVTDISGKQIIQPFIDDLTSNIVFCNPTEDPDGLEDLFQISEVKQLWINQWDCVNKPTVPKIHDGLIVLHGIGGNDLNKILEQENIQRSLMTNTWIIFTNEETEDYFESQQKLKLSLNARMFILRERGTSFYVTQILGTGTHKVVFKVYYKMFQFKFH